MKLWNNIQFAHPWLLIAIPIMLVLLVAWYYFAYKKQHATITLSTTKGLENHHAARGRLKAILPVLRYLALSALIVALARPQSTSTDEKTSTLGIDIVISIDISGSMLARDFKPDRLQATKKVAREFIQSRPNDRVGLVVFAGESFTQVPITSDHKVVLSQLEKIEYGLLQDGTAIGMGIGTAVNRLKDSKAKSKVIILMTDGENNAGLIDPITATEAAMQFGVKIYTIGVGSKGQALMPAYRLPNGELKFEYMPVNIDEDLLITIADMTGGNYYRAQNEKELKAIYEEIDRLEKTEIESSRSVRVSEKFHPFAALALMLVLLELTLRYTVLRSYP
jgi:Ca-activated chloride channel homolog